VNNQLRKCLEKNAKKQVNQPTPRGMTKIFSQSQQKLLMGEKKVKWTSADIAKALGLAVISKKAYETVRDVWKIPLPSPRTLRRWGTNFECKKGILNEVITIMKSVEPTLDKFGKLCILKFDEIGLTSQASWDRSFDIIQPPHSKVQVLMCSGICSKWNQPVYYGYDKKMTRHTLTQIIRKLELAGYKVCAIVSDSDTANQGLWTSLGVGLSKPYFENPSDPSRKIWAFADAPHMIKLLRNHLLDQGFELADGTCIQKSTLEELVKNNGKEMNACPNNRVT